MTQDGSPQPVPTSPSPPETEALPEELKELLLMLLDSLHLPALEKALLRQFLKRYGLNPPYPPV